jgi:hypothetical protein
MKNNIELWQDIRNEYLGKTEKALSKVRHPRRREVLSDVAAHLDQRFDELADDQKTWENFQAIITDMGPAAEYAELLGADTSSPQKTSGKTFNYAMFFGVIIVVALIVFAVIQKRENPKMDISIDDFYLVASSREPGKYQLIASIHNNSLEDSERFGVHFYLGNPKTEKPRTHSAGPIKPEGTWNEATVPFLLNDGTYNFSVVLDPDNKMKNKDKANNKATLAATLKDGKLEKIEKGPQLAKMVKTDISVEYLKLRPSKSQAGSYDLIASIHNKGPEDSPQFRVYFGIAGMSGPIIHNAGPIKSGGVWNEYTIVSSLIEGDNHFSVFIDPTERIDDPDRSNNVKTLTSIGEASGVKEMIEVATVDGLYWKTDKSFAGYRPDRSGGNTRDTGDDFEFFISIEEWIRKRDGKQLNEVVENAGFDFVLKANGHEDIAIDKSNYFATSYSISYNNEIRAFLVKLNESQLAKLASGVSYTLHPVKKSDKYYWKVNDGVNLIKP